MTNTEIVLAIVSAVSSAITILQFVRTEKLKANERTNVEVIREKLVGLHRELTAILHGTDAIIQIGKQQNTTVGELQNMARVLRGSIFIHLEGIRKCGNRLGEWRFGKMIPSEPLPEVVPAGETQELGHALPNPIQKGGTENKHL